MGIGNKGMIVVEEHFLGHSATAVGSTVLPQGKVNYCGTPDTTGSDLFATITDEPGGILSVTTDSDAGDSIALFIAPFRPADGGCSMEARFKSTDITENRIFCGFQETVNATTPVIAAVADTANALTHGAVGCHVGMFVDAAADSPNWFAIAGDGAVAATNSTANGKDALGANVNDEYDVVRVDLNSHGDADIWLASAKYPALHLIDHIDSAVTAGDIAYAILMIQNVGGDTSATIEVDYMNASGFVDWTQ